MTLQPLLNQDAIEHGSEENIRISAVRRWVDSQRQYAHIYAVEGAEEVAKWAKPTGTFPPTAAITSKKEKFRRHYTPDEEQEHRLTERRERRRAKAAIMHNKLDTSAASLPTKSEKPSKSSHKRKPETPPLSVEGATDDSLSDVHESKKNGKKKQKAMPTAIGLLNNLMPSNIGKDRITLKPSPTVGVFNKGKASGKVVLTENNRHNRRGRDLVFSEAKFFNKKQLWPTRSSSSSETSERRVNQVSNYFARDGKENQPPECSKPSRRSSSSPISSWSASPPRKPQAQIENATGETSGHKVASEPTLQAPAEPPPNPIPDPSQANHSTKLIEATGKGDRILDNEAQKLAEVPDQKKEQNQPAVTKPSLEVSGQISSHPSRTSLPAADSTLSSAPRESLDVLIAACSGSISLEADDEAWRPLSQSMPSRTVNCSSHVHTQHTVPNADSILPPFLLPSLADYGAYMQPDSEEDYALSDDDRQQDACCMAHFWDNEGEYAAINDAVLSATELDYEMIGVDHEFDATLANYGGTAFISDGYVADNGVHYDEEPHAVEDILSGYDSPIESFSDDASEFLDAFSVGRTLLGAGLTPVKTEQAWNTSSQSPLWPRRRA
ncbi:hypothetical protein CALVIDRAFT_561355 [Calocera viscosa TUFC12733]|uniref:Uncharacterized protein n=1 Tax=Calocera viscosa (strain TUFC12733) TaxID=1330018 RepID=A0A167Q7K5_CALVF|nr:hypothetical protein CALVIDRAFT_561355 [Calocera viscosa TUFC12733]